MPKVRPAGVHGLPELRSGDELQSAAESPARRLPARGRDVRSGDLVGGSC
jgi:hypothetical protein